MATYSDLFPGTNGAALSSQWIVPTGCTAPLIYTTAARGTGIYTCAVINAAIGADQFAEATFYNVSGSNTNGIVVRHSTTTKTGYILIQSSFDNGTDPIYAVLNLVRYVNGASTNLWSWDTSSTDYSSLYGQVIRLEISGQTLTIKRAGTIIGTVTDNSANKLTSGQPGIWFCVNSTAYLLDNFNGGDLVVNAVPGTGPFAAGSLSLSGSLGGVITNSPTVTTLPAASLSLSGSLGEKHGTTAPFTAGQVSLSGTMGYSSIVPPPPPLYSDNFNSYTSGSVLPSPWVSPTSVPCKAYLKNGVSGVGASTNTTASLSLYNMPIDINHYSQMYVDPLKSQYVQVYVRANLYTGVGYYFKYEQLYDSGTDSYISYYYLNGGGLGNNVVVEGKSNFSKIRLEAASISPSDPVRLTLYIDDIQVLQAWDSSSSSLRGGYPGIGFLSFGGASITQQIADDWSAGVVAVPPTPCTTILPAGQISLSGNIGQPIPCVTTLPAGAISLSGNIGQPIPCTTTLPAGQVSLSGNPIGGFVSRAKASTIYPQFSAYGGLSAYSNTQKGKICGDGELSIGYRVGLSNDGVKGDRVMFKLPAVQLLRADIPTNPVAKATFHCTFLQMMSFDYYASGATANPATCTEQYNGKPVAFYIRAVDNVDLGMNATLSGNYGYIEAKPIWLSGQTWYDGTTRGNPVWECEVDITPLYNIAAQNGTDLQFALECMFSNPKWVAQIVGVDPNLNWARPRIEVHRWGTSQIQITDTDTCSPTINVAPPAGASIYQIRWGYNEKLSNVYGVFKYATGQTGVIGEGSSTVSPYTLPMIDSSKRVHIEVEIDFGSTGTLIFKRTFKTPQVLNPKLQLLNHLYSSSSSPANNISRGWLDIRGPYTLLPTSNANGWQVFAKRHTQLYAPSTNYSKGDRITVNGFIWYAKNPGTSGVSTAFPTTAASVLTYNTQNGLLDNGIKWIPSVDTKGAHPIPGIENDGWELFTAQDIFDDYIFRSHVGSWSNEPNPDEGGIWNYELPWPIPYPTYNVNTPNNPTDMAALNIDGYSKPYGAISRSEGPQLHGIWDDVSQIYYDRTYQTVYFLTSQLVSGAYEIRLNYITTEDSGAPAKPCFWFNAMFFKNSMLVTTVTTRPDLGNLSCIMKAADFRHTVMFDNYVPLLMMFVADGKIQVFKLLKDYQDDATARIVSDLLVDMANITEIQYCHLLTLGGEHKTVLAAKSSGGNCWLGIREDDSVIFNDGGGFTRTPGLWNKITSLMFNRIWPTETLPTDSNNHIPDDNTVALAMQMNDGTVRFLNKNGSIISTPGIGGDADWSTARTWNLNERVVSKWPALQYDTYTIPNNAGMLSFRHSGSILYVQRVCDWLRVSDEVTVDLGSNIQKIHVQKNDFHEGLHVPVLVSCDDGYHTVLVTIGFDTCRAHLPSLDLKARFSSGKVTTSNIIKKSKNMRDPSEFTKLPGHNTFGVGWKFDTRPDGSYVIGLDGMMNEGGWNYFCFSGVQGERLRILVHDVPAFGGKWQGGILRGIGGEQLGYQPEFLGGTEWGTLKFSTWFWTNDPPTNPNRKWRRVIDGMDYILDGDSGGGMYVIDIQSAGDELYLSHDIVADLETWKGLYQSFKADPIASSKIKWAGNTGELLWYKAGDSNNGKVFSQVGRYQ